MDNGASAGQQVQTDLPPDAVASGVQLGSRLVLTRTPGAAPG